MIVKPLKNAVIWSANIYKKNPSRFLNVTTAATFSILSAGEAIAIKNNDHIPDEQKKFMVPQAICEGLINVGIILSLSTALTKLGSKLVKKGRILPAQLPDSIKSGEKITEILKLKDFKDAASKNIKDLTETSFNTIKAFHTGITTIAGPLIGLFTAQNIINPILTNKFASWYRKKCKEQNSIKLARKESPIIPALRLSDEIKIHPSFSSSMQKPNPYSFFANNSLYYNNYMKK